MEDEKVFYRFFDTLKVREQRAKNIEEKKGKNTKKYSWNTKDPIYKLKD